MTVSGSGVGGNIGGPMQPLQRDIETTAWTLVNKAAMGIVPDAIEIPLTQLGGNVWKYTSDSSRPMLKSLGHTRTGTEDLPSQTDDSWKQMMDELEGQLHPELRARLKGEMGKLFSARDRNYCILDHLMNLTAKGMAWLDKARQPQQPETAEWEHTEQNIEVAGHAIRGAVQHASQQMQGANAFLNFTGPNLPEHDDLMKFLNEGNEIQQQLDDVLKQMQDPNAPPPDKAQLTDIAQDASLLSIRYNNVTHGNHLLMLGPLFETMAAVASALSLTPTTPTLYLGLKMATMGLFSSGSAAGFLGTDIEALLKALIGGMNGALMNKAGIAKQMMLIMTLLGTISGATTLAALVAEFGIGRFPAEDEKEKEEGEVFTMELLLELLASTGLLKTVHEIAAQASGTDAKTQEIVSDGMELFSLILMAAAGGKGDLDKTKTLMKGLKTHLEGNLNKMEQYILAGIQNGTLESNSARLLDISLKQALICIRNDDFEGLVGICISALGREGGSPEELIEDLEEISVFGKVIRHACSQEVREKEMTITGMLRAG